ncbi:electron transport complex RsxE subunit [Oceanococcus atlanticus]|uniref:Ion-translocating oxidoreductase complex subunit E n=1 Tax=Oceanococcus atlanticus TaxID=1317117 RepID=A0A1Y1S9W6_9GAMM|nr:electron transport complex subunit E [Oceanococcus atlanticus]ORE85026.1 electron transport complex RsxE subunit [Oceanococcus atlanticus]RZO84474.1 MAG: electron transport complex subunit E [Oceanococcus sp.]
MATYSEITIKGLWTNNPGLVQLLGLCPLLAVSTTVINGLGLGLATMATLVASNLIVSLIRNWVRPEVRIPVFVMVIAAIVTAIELLMNAYLHQLYRVLGIFIPLIVTNCSIIGRAEAFASKNGPLPAALDGFAQGLGFALCLVVLGALREVLGHGTLLADADLLFGPLAANWEIVLIEDFRGLLLAILPPGAFLGLGLMIAGKNWFDRHQADKAKAATSLASPAAI